METNSTNSTSSTNDTIVLIPLALANTEWVNSFLACKVNDAVSITSYNGNNYQQFGYHNIADSISAEKIAKQIMFMEYESFGHNKFIIKDLNLFKPSTGNNSSTRRFYNIKNIEQGTNDVAWVVYTYCYQVWVDNNNGQVVGCPPDDLNCNQGSYQTQCSDYGFWADVIPSDGSGSSSGSGGTGNGNGWYYNSGNGGTGSSGTSTIGTSGWVSYSFSGAAHFGTWQTTIGDGNKINTWKNYNINKDSLHPCMQEILEKLMSSYGTNPLGKILAKMERAIDDTTNIEKFNIVYKMGNLGSNSGFTNNFAYNSTTGVFSATITIDNTRAQSSTDLFNANTIIHETLHAYMSYLLYRRQAATSTTTLNQFESISFDSIFSRYVDTLKASEALRLNLVTDDFGAGQDYDHNYMASYLLNMMSDALGKFVDNPAITNEYLWCLNWNGLQNSTTMQKHWVNTGNFPVQSTYALTTNDSTRGLKYALTPQRCQNIIDIITEEYSASPSAKGKPRISGGCY